MEMGENNSCREILDKFIPPNVTDSLFHYVLPSLCRRLAKNNSQDIYNLCCHLNNTTPFENTTEELCRYYESTGSEDDILYRESCLLNSDQKYNTNHYLPFMYTVLVILSPLGLSANTLIMMTVYKVKRLRNTTGYFICNLAFADVLLIIEMLLYFMIDQTGAWSKTRVRIYIFPSFDIFLGSASLLLVTAVSVERGIAVARPLKYPRYLSEKRAKILVVSIWVYCFILFIFGVLRIWIKDTNYCKIFFYITVTLSFFIPCILVVTSYNVIVFSALKTMKMEKKICKVIVAISIMNDQKLDQAAVAVRPNRCRELKVAMKVATLTIPFVCGWGYFMVTSVYEIASSYKFQGVASVMILFLPYIISCLNPLTYLMFTRTLRQSTWMILSRSHTCMKLFKLVCRRREKPVEQPIRARLLPRDRLKQMQFTAQHSKWLESKQAQTVI